MFGSPVSPSWPAGAGSSSSSRSTAQLFPEQGCLGPVGSERRNAYFSVHFLVLLSQTRSLVGSHPAGKELSCVNELSPFKPFAWSCFEVKVQASQSFLSFTMVAPGEAVPLSATSLPNLFSIPPLSLSHSLGSHWRVQCQLQEMDED